MLYKNCKMCGGQMALEHVDHIPYTEPKHHYVKDVQPLKTTEKKLSQPEIKKLFYDPTIGLIGLDKFYKKLKILDKNIKYKDIKEFYTKQEINQLFKRETKPKIYNTMYANYPNDIFEIDYIIYDRFEINHYKYIFCCIDVYSRYACCIACTNMTIPTIINCLQKVFKNMNTPRIIKGDQQFARKEIVDFLDKNNVGTQFTSAYELNKNPIVERFNMTLARNINKYRQATKNKKWFEYLDTIVKNYNNTYHKTIQHTPAKVYNGLEFNEQKIIKLTNNYKLGDQVRLKIKKKLFDKNDLTTHSKEVYLIEEIKRNKYKLNNNEWYKEYEITPANTIEFVPDDQYPEIQKEIQEIIKPVPRKKKDVDEALIINDSKRIKKTIDYNKLNKGL